MSTPEKRFLRREAINHWIVCGYTLRALINVVRSFEQVKYNQSLNIY